MEEKNNPSSLVYETALDTLFGKLTQHFYVLMTTQ